MVVAVWAANRSKSLLVVIFDTYPRALWPSFMIKRMLVTIAYLRLRLICGRGASAVATHIPTSTPFRTVGFGSDANPAMQPQHPGEPLLVVFGSVTLDRTAHRSYTIRRIRPISPVIHMLIIRYSWAALAVVWLVGTAFVKPALRATNANARIASFGALLLGFFLLDPTWAPTGAVALPSTPATSSWSEDPTRSRDIRFIPAYS